MSGGNRNKAKGTAGETATVKFLCDKGFNARREVLHGSVDQGDVHVALPDGRLLVVSVKVGRAAETASMELMDKWLSEAEKQAGAAGADLACLVTKVAGRGDARVSDWQMSYREPWGRVQTRLGNFTAWIKEN